MADNELNNLPPAEEAPPEPPPEEPESPEDAPEAPEPEDKDTPAEPVDEPPDPAALQAEIEKLNAQKKKAADAAKYWRQQKAQARAEYFRDQRKPEEAPKPADTELKKPDPNSFDDYNDYVDALTDWKVEAKRRAWEAEEAEKQKNESYQQKQNRLQDKINEGYGKYEDFEEVAMDPAAPITPMIVEILAESDAPADVAYYLGKNRTEAIAISRMTPIAAAREIAKIETKIAASGPAPPTPKKTTKAPPPIKPVGSGPAAVSKDPAKMTQREYEAWRESQGARRY